MTTKLTRHSAGAALDMLPDGVLVVRLTGPLTGDALQHFKAQIVALHGPDILAFVADYTMATLVLTGAELDAVLEGEPDGAAPTMPAALVVRADQHRMFLEHALRMASRGTLRRAFTSTAHAMAWAHRHAARLRT